MALHVSDLVLLAPGQHRVVEHGGDRRRQRLGAVEDEQRGLGDVESPLAQAREQSLHHRRVLGVAFHEGEGVLGPVDADAHGHDAQMLGEVDPVDHDRHQVELREVRRHELCQCRFCRCHEAARHRRLGGRVALGLHGLAHRLEPHGVAAGGELGKHSRHRLVSEELGGRRQLVGGELHLGGLVDGAHSGPADGHLARTQGHEPGVGPMAHRRAIRVVPTPLAGECGASSSRITSSTFRPVPTAKASKPSQLTWRARRWRR